ncbi:LTA synthase family protein [Burkholderia cenocepacia]|uniref:LTA synthase family protein n=1 Tax=Burkholderia cenocepacia TaxID=95486 RepID=UPI002854ACB6|nr:LTA synthase family protein [Burkholderia cenocepacia]MDR8035478.1 LTA synthase family protein [Burkholderia cenocepacia]
MSARLAVTLTAVVVLSFAVDSIAVPRAPLRRPLLSSVLHILSVVFLFDFVFAFTSRPLFSACAALALVALVAAVSNAKYESLREPFVFTDLSLFSQLFSHPRLYLPFLSTGKVVAIGVGIVLVIAGFGVERPAPAGSGMLVGLTVGLSFMLAVLVAARVPLTLDPDTDQRRHGFFAVFVSYLLNGLRPATFRQFREVAAAGLFATGKPSRRPDVVVIQSESFFDARRLGGAVKPNLFRHFDLARREAVWHGEMTVPAWGANTMRTEFAVLTGTASFSLGYARFYPYVFVRNKIVSLASWFDRCGYDTVAIHPYYADFFGRNRVFPLLGFTRFLDIRHFASATRSGPYVADAAVSESIIAELEAASDDQPRFVFVMTMENHGPLHLEQVLPGESYSRHTLGEDASWRDLTAYLRHIENADVMIGRLIDYLRTSNRETVVCFYGDHVPALPHVFEKLGVSPQTSDYFIWRNYGTDTPECRNLAAEELGAALLHVVQDDGNRAEQPHASEKAT